MKMNLKKAALMLLAGAWAILTVAAWLLPSKDISYTERRELAQFPELNAENLLNGSFMTDFEEYSLDQFPLRDRFRRLKALVQYNVLGQKDNNGIYLVNGVAAQLEYPMNESSVDHALQVLNNINEKYLSQSKVFVAVVPDKGYYLAAENGYPAMDYDALFAKVRQSMPYAQHIDLTGSLGEEDYYRTDTHWRQERLDRVAQTVCGALGIAGPGQMTQKTAQQPFYGVYYGQAALPMEPDELVTLHSNVLDGCTVYNYETGETVTIYDESKLTGKDLYEVFLSGPVSVLRIDNPNAQSDKELIVFRDSFGSSLAPLLVQGYKSITLVDVRYTPSALLSRFVEFKGQDVLFLYSTLILNNSNMMK